MADEESTKDIQLLKRTRISVFVDEALPDILVVTYNHGVKIFKGVLLDSTKKNIPCGIQSLNPAFKTTKPKPDDDPLYSVSQRFAYTDPGMAKKKNTQMTGRHKHSKMTVRLRPRQVLCSKCKGICNENSENVSRKRKSTSESAPPPNLPPIKRGLNAPVTRSVSIYTTEQNKKKLGGEATLIPKLTRLTAEQERSVLNRSSTTTTTTTTSHLRQLRNVHKKRRGEVGAEKSEATVAAAAAPPVVVASNKENQEDSHRQHSEDHSADDEDDDDEGRGRDKDREDEEEEGDEEDDSSNSDDEDDDDKNDSTRHRPDEHHNRSALTCYVSSRPTDRRTLRKKRSIGSMEDLWDETVFEEHAKRSNLLPHEEETDPLAIPEDPLNTNTSTGGGGSTNNNNNNNGLGTSTRTIKISYGPQGEGTVLKIPAQIDKLLGERGAGARTTSSNSTSSIEDNFVGADEDTNTGSSSVLPPPPVPAMLGDDSNDKAARRALKRAKKEARRKVFTRAGGSPLYLSSSSPRYSIMGNSSPRYTVGSASPRHGLGNNSPRYMVAPYELNIPRRRKHKMKHKKKHKEDRDKKHKEAEVSSTQDESKEQQQQFVTQKLSINLKRLNNTLYTSYPVTTTTTSQESQQQQQQQPPRSAEDENNTSSSSSDEHGNYNEQQVPDFPPPNPPLMLRINSQTLASATTADGGRMLVGDVVWGKIHGFPWWPGKVLAITNCGGQGGRPRAQVAWYGSSTSSLMRCDQLSPYLENFKIRYNKKKRGPYKEAIKQATLEARENAESRSRQPLGNSPSHSNIITSQVVPPALASPREIDVAS